MMFGGGEQGDLVADLGIEWTPEGTGLMQARSHVPLPELARRLGHMSKVAIHPAQIPIINDVFTPGSEVVAYQRKILAAFEEADAHGSASIAVDGKVVGYAMARVA